MSGLFYGVDRSEIDSRLVKLRAFQAFRLD